MYLLSFTPEKAPVNTQQEFLAFCGTLGLGKLLIDGRKEYLIRLRLLASDPRWRTREVEELTREAFWVHHVPGCDEHYLVHVLRSHPDFIPELDFVAIVYDKIVGNIMYTKSRLIQ